MSGVLSLDLRKMAFDDSYVSPAAKAKEPLRRLYAWLATRFQDEKGQPVDTDLNDMPSFDVVWEQFLRLRGETMFLPCTFSVTNHLQSLLPTFQGDCALQVVRPLSNTGRERRELLS